MYYASSTGAFYSLAIHGGAIPTDAVEISDDEHRVLLEGLAAGKCVVMDSHGRPVLKSPATDNSPARCARDIAARRYQAETAGITAEGTHVPTDRDSQALVTGAALAAVLDPNYTCRWKTGEGFVTLAAEQIIAMASDMRAHVQACFDREAELLAALEAGSFTQAMLDEGWPA